MFLLLCACLASGWVVRSAVEKPYYNIEEAEQLFEEFILTHGKSYSRQEQQMRLEIFKDSLKRINLSNSVGNAVYAVNNFSDLSSEEINEYMGFVTSSRDGVACDILTDRNITTEGAPNSLDWVSQGAVTAIKNQRRCGSCWAFACIGNIEGRYFLKTKQLQIFSEQELVDCSRSNSGCDGGDMVSALMDVKELGGVVLESSYPYTGKDGICQFNSTKVVAKVKGCKKYVLNDEKSLKEVLANNGPLIIGISHARRLRDYHKGIMTREECVQPQDTPSGHAVLLTGYGTAEDGTDYWMIRNSWGDTYGEQGYFRISRGENTCGILDYVSTAELL